MSTPIPSNLAEFTRQEIQQLTQAVFHGVRGEGTSSGAVVRGVETDSRRPLAGKLFVALRGERFDAHQFVAQAEAAGAAAALVECPVQTPGQMPQFVVKSSLAALGELAKAHRGKYQLPVVAVAGSCGKTTTKTVLGAIVRHALKKRVLVTPGNLNNQIGVPMVLLGLTEEHEAAVVELGTNQPGEVACLTEMVAPTASILTLIDLEHTQGLGDLDAIEAEEGAVLRGPRVVIGNADDERVMRQLAASCARVITYGTNAASTYRVALSALGASGSRIMLERPSREKLELCTPLVGEPQALAVAAAVAVVEQVLGHVVNADSIQRALEATDALPEGRLKVIHLMDDTLVVDDAYNANPASVKAAITVAQQLASFGAGVPRRLHLVLGEMRELGLLSEREHRRIGDRIAAVRPASIVAVAGHARHFLHDSLTCSHFVEHWQAAKETLAVQLRPGDVVLIKGSRSTQLDRLADALVSERGRK